jgi:hypothetical protein
LRVWFDEFAVISCAALQAEECDVSERVSATGTCTRCRAELDLASVRVGDAWFCRAACAAGETVTRTPAVESEALINRPRRYYGRRDARELKRRSA